jgi:hypothetical protein
VVTTEMVLMLQWVGYNFVIKPHIFFIYITLRKTSYVKVKIPEIKSVQTIVNVEVIANAVCEWNGQDNERIATLLS